MIAVDASALIAIAEREADQDTFLEALVRADAASISSINYVETGIVLIRRGLIPSMARLDDWLASMRIERRDDLNLGGAALSAYLTFGRGFHRARLNLADSFAYALAKTLDAPLLYKGDGFAKTDIRSAL